MELFSHILQREQRDKCNKMTIGSHVNKPWLIFVLVMSIIYFFTLMKSHGIIIMCGDTATNLYAGSSEVK